jgi:hypothetical protein
LHNGHVVSVEHRAAAGPAAMHEIVATEETHLGTGTLKSQGA